MKNTLKVILILLISSSSVFGQDYVTKKTADPEALQLYAKAQESGMKGENRMAIETYEKALEIEPNFIDAYLYIADAYYALEEFETSEIWFEKVIKIDPTYDTRVLYVLGALEYRMDKYTEAADHFEFFLKLSHKSPSLLNKARSMMETSRFAAEAVKNPLPFEPKNLENINTELPEYLPCFTADGNYMIYTSRYGGQEDFFQSQKINGEWIKGINIGEPINTLDNEGAETISADGRFLVYTVCNRREDFGGCDLYFSEMKNGEWSIPQNIGLPVNSTAWESQPSLSADGRTLYFVSSRNGGRGKKDLWVTYKMKNGRWMQPRNLGDVINTSGNESSPHIHADGQTLYFSSDGHVGMGEADMFMTTRQADGSWSKPKNLGYPINTKAAENSLVVSLDGSIGYFASDREDSKGATDIYSFEMPQSIRPKPVTYLKAQVTDAATGFDLQAEVELVQLSTGLVYTEAITTESGEFLICLPSGDDYALNVSRKGYLFYSENFALKEATSFAAPFEANVKLQPIDVAIANTNENETKTVILKNVFFESGVADLKSISKSELDKLVILLNENPTMKIQINGHTDNVGNPETNQNLSLNRATSVMNYVIKNGIEAIRLTAKGFGESQPIDTNETAEGRKNNRRTEFLVK
jgi:outer membrane protein OmpA-like peptidoglycan-associated protein/tetratricopeptide (TPR) repeat protein